MPPKKKKGAPKTKTAGPKKLIVKQSTLTLPEPAPSAAKARAAAAAQAKAWRAAVGVEMFACMSVRSGKKTFPLRGEQQDELKAWLGGSHDKEWLRVTKGVPMGFVNQAGDLDVLTLAAAWQHKATAAATGAKKAAAAVAQKSAAAAAAGIVQPPLQMAKKSGKVVSKACLLASKMCDMEDDFASGALRYDEYAATEKHDGHRGVWHNGKMYTRRGNEKPQCQEFFRKFIPKGLTLDGEMRPRSTKTDRTKVPGLISKLPQEQEKTDLGFFVFDAPFLEGNYLERLAAAEKLVKPGVYVQFVQPRVCKTRAELRDHRTDVVKGSGEGLVLHRIDVAYRFQVGSKRSADCIKYKERYDQEVKVVGFAKTGYAHCVFPKSTQRFSVNTLANPVKCGGIICIEFLGLTKYGLPEHPVFKDYSPDRQDWALITADFPEQKFSKKNQLRRVYTGPPTSAS